MSKVGYISKAELRARVSAGVITCVEDILRENALRYDRIFGRHDQLTGEGMEGHTEKVVIRGYPIPTQYLTDEVAGNRLYEIARKCGSVAKMRRWLKTHEDLDISDEEIIEELTMRRIERDPSFAFRVVYQITDKMTGNVVPFLLNYAQRIMLWRLEQMRLAGEPIFMVLLKARQWGGSTLAQLYISWIQLFVRDGWNSVIIAQTKDTARRIKGMYTLALENIPYFIYREENIKFSPWEASQSDFIVTNGKRIPLRRSTITVVSFENYESARGANFAMFHGSEVAYWKTTPGKSAESLITNIDGGMNKEVLNVQILESTARGNSGFFYDEYQLAKAGKSNRQALFVPYAWLEKDMKPFKDGNEKRKFAQWLWDNRDNTYAPDDAHDSGAYNWSHWIKGATLEHIHWYIHDRAGKHSHEAEASEAPIDDVECFTFAGNKVFSAEFVAEQAEEHIRRPMFVGDIRDYEGEQTLTDLTNESGGLLKIWRQPDKLKTKDQYVVVVDLGGKRDKADYSVITVINRWGLTMDNPDYDPKDKTSLRHLPLEVVARWRGHLRYDMLAWKAVAVARYYKNAMLVFESNSFDQKRAQKQEFAGEFVESGDNIRGILDEIGDEYENLYMRAVTNSEKIRQGRLTEIGFQTNVKTKQDIVANFDKEWSKGGFIDHDEVFYAEAGIYEQRPDGSYGNIVGANNHDDVLMTDMIGAYVSAKMDKPRISDGKDDGIVVM